MVGVKVEDEAVSSSHTATHEQGTRYNPGGDPKS